jgi:nucleotide-binding universal stress UspA family protein
MCYDPAQQIIIPSMAGPTSRVDLDWRRMDTFRKLFVAIDFSPDSDEALRQAHERAESTGAQLAVCHIIPNHLRSNLLFPQISRVAALKVPLELNQFANTVSTRVSEITGRTEGEFELIVDDGTPQALILSHAEEWKADIIFMGSHGETDAVDALLGSITNSVLRHAHCPVLVIRPGKMTRRIIAGTDFSDPSLVAVKAAAKEAARINAKLTVVHSLDLIWTPASYPAMAFGGTPTEMSAEEIKELESVAQKRLEEVLKQAHITAETLVTVGAAASAIIEVASEEKAQLIVVGTVGRTGLRRALLGSVAEAVAKGAPCSVLVVRRDPD